MADMDRLGNRVGKVFVDRIDAHLLEIQYGREIDLGVALAMGGKLFGGDEPHDTTYFLYKWDLERLINELIKAATEAYPDWRDQVLDTIQRALDLNRREP
jgi:hypothetical protein